MLHLPVLAAAKSASIANLMIAFDLDFHRAVTKIVLSALLQQILNEWRTLNHHPIPDNISALLDPESQVSALQQQC